MNTNKIREWLERVATMDEDPSFGRMSSDVRLKLAMAGVKAALAEIDKAVTDEELYRQAMEDVTPDALERMDKAIRAIDAAAPKVLTDDMVNTVVNLEKKLHLRENGSEKEADIWARGVMSGMIQARDNGYLVPAAGLTVEEAMDVLLPWLYRDGENTDDLRVRLTAKLNVKNQ